MCLWLANSAKKKLWHFIAILYTPKLGPKFGLSYRASRELSIELLTARGWRVEWWFFWHSNGQLLFAPWFFTMMKASSAWKHYGLNFWSMRNPTQNLWFYWLYYSQFARPTIVNNKKGQFTKFYPKFHLTHEFLTYTNIIIIWFSLLVWISHIVAAHAPISHFSGARAPISHFLGFEFLSLPACARKFLTFGFEFLTFCTPALWISHFLHAGRSNGDLPARASRSITWY